MKEKKRLIGSWTVDPNAGSIASSSESKRIPPLLMRLLLCLADSHNQTLSREELLKDVWLGVVVNEEAVSRAIAELRSILGDSAKNPKFIETVSKQGYRLIAPIDSPSKSIHSHLIYYYGASFGLLLIIILVAYVGLFSRDVVIDLDIQARPVAISRNPELDPALSPDGKMLAYSMVDGSNGYYQIWIDTIDNPGRRQLTNDSTHHTTPVFLSDNDRIVFQRLTDEQCSLQLFIISTSIQKELSQCDRTSKGQIDIDREGQQLAFIDRHEDGASGIFVYNLVSGEITSLTHNLDSNSNDSQPKFMRDARSLSFLRGNSSTREIYRIDRTSKQITQLTFDKQYVRGHAWLADRDEILYASDRTGFRALWLLNPVNQSYRLMGARGAMNPRVAARSGDIVYERASFDANIWRVDLQQKNEPAKRITDSAVYDNQPALSPDGKTLIFGSLRSGNSALWIAESDGRSPRLLYEQKGGRVVHPIWSADGRHILLMRYTRAGSEILELEPVSESIRVISQAGLQASAAVYGGQGKWIYYIQNELHHLYRVSIENDSKPEWVSPLIKRIVLGRDGTLYVNKIDTPGIFRLDGKQPTRIIDALQASDAFHWTAAKYGLVYLRRNDEEAPELVYFNTSNGEEEKMSDFVPTAIGTTLALSPDDRFLYVSRTDRADIDVMFVKNPTFD